METRESPQQPGEPLPAAVRPCFLTLTTPGRQPWLERPRTRDVFLAVLRAWHMERDGRVLAATVLPDRAHVLLEPGATADVTQLPARWKAGMRRAAGYAETFERDCHGHRLRASENPEVYALYCFLQPYRARLIGPEEHWPGWWLPDATIFQFPAALEPAGQPPLEWIQWPDEKFAGLTLGA